MEEEGTPSSTFSASNLIPETVNPYEDDEFYEANDHGQEEDGGELNHEESDEDFVEASDGDATLEKQKVDTSDEEDEVELMKQLNLSDEELESIKIESIQLKQQGNEKFKDGKYVESIDLYTKSLKVCPKSCLEERSVLHSNRATARLKLIQSSSAVESEEQVEGNEEKEEKILMKEKKSDKFLRYEKVIKDCSKSITLNPSYLKPLIRRASLFHELGGEHLDSSLSDYKKVLELDPNSFLAKSAIFQLENEIRERNEKLKEEMMGKLKELGNFVLKPFGLSTNNFKLDQNPDTGGYSINFKQ